MMSKQPLDNVTTDLIDSVKGIMNQNIDLRKQYREKPFRQEEKTPPKEESKDEE